MWVIWCFTVVSSSGSEFSDVSDHMTLATVNVRPGMPMSGRRPDPPLVSSLSFSYSSIINPILYVVLVCIKWYTKVI